MSKALVFLIVLYVSSYRSVHFSRAVLFCQPHQQFKQFNLPNESTQFAVSCIRVFFVFFLSLCVFFSLSLFFFFFFFACFFFLGGGGRYFVVVDVVVFSLQ